MIASTNRHPVYTKTNTPTRIYRMGVFLYSKTGKTSLPQSQTTNGVSALPLGVWFVHCRCC